MRYKDGDWTFDRAYQYSDDLNDMKQPLVAAIVMGGWIYQTAVTFLPLLRAWKP